MTTKKYSRLKLLCDAGLGSVLGSVAGTIEGGIGSLAVPTSLRTTNDTLDETIDSARTYGNDEKVYSAIGNGIYHYLRLTTGMGIQATAMYKMVEDIANGGDLSYGLLALPNLISLGYEISRMRGKKA